MFYPLVLVYYILYMIMDFLYPDATAMSVIYRAGLSLNRVEWAYSKLLPYIRRPEMGVLGQPRCFHR